MTWRLSLTSSSSNLFTLVSEGECIKRKSWCYINTNTYIYWGGKCAQGKGSESPLLKKFLGLILTIDFIYLVRKRNSFFWYKSIYISSIVEQFVGSERVSRPAWLSIPSSNVPKSYTILFDPPSASQESHIPMKNSLHFILTQFLLSYTLTTNTYKLRGLLQKYIPI